ncbi:hypothetical protein FE257_007920 [Aspergillus nanangensis]|uniref:AAA+ ATPase domain-containing protein n=1 Tax=Aspergillus nanangensis TaxID=2582783 RepID=A0AAD4GYV3_ASPNN|nr:hypothetical protein FE257_007920 [Aspergillus nanangensis]
MAPFLHTDYSVAWICALPLEMAAGNAMLDKTHDRLSQPSTDPNAYILGELHGHYIVIACLPAGVYGTISAANLVSHLVSTFPRIQLALMVGIGGGVPGTPHDIRLGDVVVSRPVGKYSGVIQYDYGKALQDGHFEPTGILNKPPQTLLTHMARLEASQLAQGENSILKIISDVLNRNLDLKRRFSRPNGPDNLFCASYPHVGNESNCLKCDKTQLLDRSPRDTATPSVHYGLIASGDRVMKDSTARDLLAQQLGVICFEMEAAGLMDELPTLVIRGICDYCDTHKQKDWQQYAALTASAFAKLLLSVVPVSRTEDPGLLNQKVRHWIVPFAKNPKFVGRQHEVAELEKLIAAQDGPARTAITGLGGVGKTQVALQVAHRIRDRDNECSIFWIPCTSHAMVEQIFLNIVQTLGIPNANPAEAKEQAKTYFSSERAGRWLLIFDNADDAEMWSTLEQFLPQSEQGRILFTSRHLELAVDLTFSNIIAIPDMDRDTARQILEKSLIQRDLLNNHTKMITLLEQLAYLPLAIVQASAYINKKRIDLSTYSALLKETEKEAVKLLSEDFRDPGRYSDIQNPVMTTWLISFNQIQQQNRMAANYLSFMACIDPRKIPRSLLLSQVAKKETIDALGLLSAYSFISTDGTDISIHSLVHIASRNWLRENSLLNYWVERVADQLDEAFPDDHYTNRALWREYLPHALALMRGKEFQELLTDRTNLTDKIARCLAIDGRFNEAEVLYHQLIQIEQAKNGAEHPNTLISMANLASIYQSQGRLNKAEQLKLQVVEIRKTVLGTEHPDTLTSMANLALTFWSQGRWNKAEQLGLQVVEIRKTLLGTEHPDTLTSMANLASTYHDQGRLVESEQLQIQVMKTRKSVLGVEHPATMTSVHNLAYTWNSMGKHNKALQLMTECTRLRAKHLGPSHPNTLSSSDALAQWQETESHGSSKSIKRLKRTV